MISQAGLVAVTLTGLSLGGTGAALLVAARARVAGSLLVATGALLIAGALLDADHQSEAALILTAAGVLGSVSLMAYPRLRWRHPVDFVSLVALLGCGTAMVLWRGSTGVDGTLGLFVVLILFCHTWWRIETSAGGERRALAWMGLSTSLTGFAFGLSTFALESTLVPQVAVGGAALVGPALYVGATLPEIVDVRALIVRATVFSTTVVVYLSVFVPIMVALDSISASSPNPGLVGVVAGVLAAGFAPTQRLLRGVVDELLFGHRPDPLVAASRLAGGLGEDPASALDAIRESLVLPYAELLVDGEVLAASGEPVPHCHTLVVDDTAELRVGIRAGDLALSPADRRVLDLTAPLLSQALRARALAADLAESRGQTIAAREEERRRLRRDLHDGLGPRLSGVAFTSDAARNLLRSDPDAADALLATLRAETATAIEEIRQLVYAMRPPALDELGLVAALRQRAADLRLAVTVEAEGDLGTLPAAVEVAAYRIVTESLTNAARHSTGDAARVALAEDERGLRIEVLDNGTANATAGSTWRPGVGLGSMRERAAELGGTLTVGATPEGGRVSAWLPR